jgi:hypothetical protein
MARIKDFLEALASNEGLAASFEETPVSVMVQHDLDAGQRRLIMDGTIAEIRDQVEKDLKAEGLSDAVYVIRVKRG